MRGIVLCVLLFVYHTQSQYVESEDIPVKLRENALMLVKSGKNLRGLTDIWNNIKNSAKHALNTLKAIAHNTKEKINNWMKNVKDRAQDISKVFVGKVTNIREKSKTIIEQIAGAGQLVKNCFKKENKMIEDILKQIMKSVALCISENIKNLSRFEAGTYEIDVNITEFLTEIENELGLCLDKKENVEECMQNVRTEIYDKMEIAETNILNNRIESRNVIDKILDSIMICSVDGLLEASKTITMEAINIISCVIKG